MVGLHPNVKSQRRDFRNQNLLSSKCLIPAQLQQPFRLPPKKFRCVCPDVQTAMRVSNLIAVVLLFVTGYVFGRCSEHRPVMTGLAMVLLGSLLVSFTIALGG
jgi:hypothetical protein